MLALQTADPDIAIAARWLMTSVPPRGVPALQSVSPTLLALWQHSARLRLVDGLLYRIYDTPQDPINQLVVPTAARSDVMKALHNDASSAHLGITKTLDKARRRYYWPGMSSDIENWIRACPICQARQGPNPKQAARLRSQQSSFPLQRVAMDIMGPLPTTARQKQIHTGNRRLFYQVGRSLCHARYVGFYCRSLLCGWFCLSVWCATLPPYRSRPTV